MVTRTEKATSWHDAANSLRGLVNHEGYVPIRTRLTSADLDFLEGAREELLGFAALGVRLLDLHQPRDAGGITSDAANPILRCRSCMWRWPCPTFRAMAESFCTPRAPNSCQHVEPDRDEGPKPDHENGTDPGRENGTGSGHEGGTKPGRGGGTGGEATETTEAPHRLRLLARDP
ncbi:hypothetical protein [Streptosporangium carneum]|nr:hypothetical protein [Streptosporangium carneum]